MERPFRVEFRAMALIMAVWSLSHGGPDRSRRASWPGGWPGSFGPGPGPNFEKGSLKRPEERPNFEKGSLKRPEERPNFEKGSLKRPEERARDDTLAANTAPTRRPPYGTTRAVEPDVPPASSGPACARRAGDEPGGRADPRHREDSGGPTRIRPGPARCRTRRRQLGKGRRRRDY